MAGCAQEPTRLPDAHSELAGTWEHGHLPRAGEAVAHVYAYLTIEADGTASYAWYERGEQGRSCKVIAKAALTHTDDDVLEARVFWPIATELAIEEGPQRNGPRWTMIVDGVELERVSEQVDERAGRFGCSDGLLVADDEAASSGGDGDRAWAIPPGSPTSLSRVLRGSRPLRPW